VTGHGDSGVYRREIGSILCDVLEWIEMMHGLFGSTKDRGKLEFTLLMKYKHNP
jgi:hypothetical protein